MRTKYFTAILTCLMLLSSSVFVLADSGTEMVPTEHPGDRLNYTPSSPITIDSDADFTPANGVVSGDGTETDPWVIEGWEIDGTGGYCVYIGNTTDYFVIRDCHLHSAGAGAYSHPYFEESAVALSNVSNGAVEGNLVLNNIIGIYLYDSENNTVEGNNASLNPGWAGIFLDYSSNNTISNNIARENWCGIYLSYSFNNTIEGNNASANTAFAWNDSGIYLENSDNNTLFSNDLYDNYYGVYMTNSNGNLIYRNALVGNIDFNGYDDTGGNLWNSTYLTGGNHWGDYAGSDADGDGIGDTPYVLAGGAGAQDNHPLVKPISNGRIQRQSITIDSDADFTLANGVVSGDGTETNPWVIEGWDIDGTGGYCVYIGNTTDYFVIRDCHLHSAGAGAYSPPYFEESAIVLNNVSNGAVEGNLVLDNIIGIYLYDSENNTVEGNNASANTAFAWNDSGIYLENSDNNTLFSNDLYYNYYGVYMTNSNGNLIYRNALVGNIDFNGYDDTGGNLWNSTYPTGGNFWDNHTVPDTKIGPDQDIDGISGDGIVDGPYDFIAGGSGIRDFYPLTTPDYIPITIDSIKIVDTAVAGSDEIMDATLNVGETVTGYAAAFNSSTGYYFGDVSAAWSVANSGGATATAAPLTGTGSTFDAELTGGTAVWTADYEGMADSVTFTITPPTVDYILIRSAPGGAGMAIPDITVNVGFTLTGYAAGYNDTAGYVGDVSADWSVINSPGASAFTAPATGTSSTFNANLTGGTANWTADYLGMTCEIMFTITPPTVDYILIRTGANGSGDNVVNSTVNVGHTVTGYAASFNQTALYIGDVPVTWSLSTSGGSSAFITIPSDPVTVTNETTVSNATDDLKSFFLNNTNLVEFIELIYNNGTGWYTLAEDEYAVDLVTGKIALNDSFAVANGSQFNSWYTYISSDNSTFNANLTGGTAVWTANYMGKTRSVTFTITPPSIDYIEIRSGIRGTGTAIQDAALNVGDAVNGFVSAYNATSGYVRDVPVIWTVTNAGSTSSLSHKTGTYTTFHAGLSGGIAVWTADYNGKTYSVTYTIAEPTVDYILVRSRAGGAGNVMSDASLLPQSVIDGYAASYNHTAGYIGDVSADWSVANDGAESFTGPITGTSSIFNAGTAPGNATWTANHGGKAFSVNYVITAGPLHRIDVSPGSATLTALDTAQFTAIGYDEHGNEKSGVIFAWSTNDPAASALGGLFKAHTAGAWTVTASSSGVQGSAQVTVSVGQLAGITVSPTATHMTADESRQFHATGHDARGNVITGLAFTWSTTDSRATIADGLFSARTAGTWKVFASSGGITSSEGLVGVEHGALSSISVTPSGQSISATDSLQFSVVGLDSKGNEIPNLSYVWASTDSGAGLDNTGLFRANKAGSWTVTATLGGISGTATITVTSGPVTALAISLPPATTNAIRMGGSLNFSAMAYDSKGNPVDSEIVWSTNDPEGVVSSGVYTPGRPGNWVVTASVGGSSTSGRSAGGVSASFAVNVMPQEGAASSGQIPDALVWVLLAIVIIILALLLLMKMNMLPARGSATPGKPVLKPCPTCSFTMEAGSPCPFCAKMETGEKPADSPDEEMPAEEMPPEEDGPADTAEPDAEPIPAEESTPEELPAESEELPQEPAPAEPEGAPEVPAEPEDPRIAKLREAYESGKISKELYEKNLARFKGQ